MPDLDICYLHLNQVYPLVEHNIYHFNKEHILLWTWDDAWRVQINVTDQQMHGSENHKWIKIRLG